MIGLVIAAALAQAAAGPADPCHAAGQPEGGRPGCPQWRWQSRIEGAETFVDPASVRRDGDRFEILNRSIFAVPLREATSVIIRYRYDCARRTVTGLHAVFYDARGAPLREFTPTGAQAEPGSPVPGSPFEAVMNEFCPRAS